MNARHIIFSTLLAAAVGLGSCADDGTTDPGDIKAHDSASLDSTMPAHVQDPSTAFPQPPVTGSQVDSSRTTDSAGKKGDTSLKK
jgi:hypothetical protein